MKEIYRLCYVDGPCAYFTTRDLDKQWGDDWNDAPYWCNAGPPSDYSGDGKVLKVFYDGPYEPWAVIYPHKYVSVEDINSKNGVWLSALGEKLPDIRAGISFGNFCKMINKSGGRVYESKGRDNKTQSKKS